MTERGKYLKTLPASVGLPWEYFDWRAVRFYGHGPVTVSPKSTWGYCVSVFTKSHDTDCGPGPIGKGIERGVIVDDYVWIASNVTLVGCHIGRGAIVAAGTVVRGQDVAPGVMVAGNPARVIARWDGEKWAYLDGKDSGFARKLE